MLFRSKACIEFGLCLIGEDRKAAASILSNSLFKSPAFDTPQELNGNCLAERGIYFDLLRDLLEPLTECEHFRHFFRNRYVLWFPAQATPAARAKLLSSIQPGWGFLEQSDLTSLAQLVKTWVWNDVAFAKDLPIVIDQPTFEDEGWQKGRDRLHGVIVSGFCITCSEQLNLSPAAKGFLAAVCAARWDAASLIEQIGRAHV